MILNELINLFFLNLNLKYVKENGHDRLYTINYHMKKVTAVTLLININEYKHNLRMRRGIMTEKNKI